jgi:3D (Asp-Asp-Asp) domain-containing protein
MAFRLEAGEEVLKKEFVVGELPMIGQNSLLPIEAIITEEITATITQYTPRPEETDSTPFITASGKRVEEGIVANNCLEFGTLVEIENEFYMVEDRMNKRFGCNHFDIFAFSLEEALKFGKQTLSVTIYD